MSSFSTPAGRQEKPTEIYDNIDLEKIPSLEKPKQLSTSPRATLAAACAIYFIYSGIMMSFGILQEHLLETGLTDLPTISLMGATSSAIPTLLGIPAGFVLQYLGPNKTAFIGGTLMGFGQILSGGFTHSVPGLFATQIIYGIGASLSYITVASASQYCFPHKSSLSSGLVFGSGGLGAATMALSMDAMIKAFGISTTLYALGSFVGAVCIAASLVMNFPPREKANDKRKGHGWSALFTNNSYCLILATTLVGNFATMVPPNMLPLSALRMSEGPNIPGSVYVAIFNIASAISRILVGFIADRYARPTTCLLSGLWIGGLSMLLMWPFATTTALLITFTIISGAATGVFFSLLPTATNEVCQPLEHRDPRALSIVTTLYAPGYFFGPPIASVILEWSDKTNTHWDPVAHLGPVGWYAGGLMLVSTIPLGVIILLRRKAQVPVRITIKYEV
ncbi:major facilitator superfamily domain-containing protein [Paraphoma chrysanthemicola]|uniref:Major facilitator superfamily domain-containing protein n=1 Tax=Paraphoma chrysanthemicola TaxID=798071 RepID=A0A8K0VZY6_9PLEO|nr:major facilitator superfamily domain-containing protein [Paraphoma chrysanthemicola]